MRQARSGPIPLALGLLLGGYFVYASLDKIASPAAFAKVVYQWQVGGPVLSNLVAVTLPWVELLAGALLAFGLWRRAASLVIALLLVVFLLAAGSVLARGIDVQNCGCTSLAAEPAPGAWPPPWTRGVGWFLISRNLLLLGVALWLARPEPVSAEAGRLPAQAGGAGGGAKGNRS